MPGAENGFNVEQQQQRFQFVETNHTPPRRARTARR
jgi:hypothetical protein